MKAVNPKEMVGGCCVCSDERGWPENPLVYCDGQNCTVAVHQACYGIVTVPTGPWYCRKCESHERPARVRCELCPSRNGALKKTDNQGWAHVVCALYIPEVRFGNVTTMEPIILQLIPQERYTKTCYICQELGKPARATFGACMQCNKTNCKQQFHVTCAQSLGLLCEEAGNYLDNVKYCGYCQHHYSKLKIGDNKKGGNVKTIPPYKPITHDNDSSSPEKEIDAEVNATASSTSTTSIKITTNTNTSSASISTKQRKTTTISNKSGSSSTTNNTVSVTNNNGNNPNGMQSLHSTTNNNNSNTMSNNNTNNSSTNNTATATGNPVGSSVATNSTSIVRSSSSSSSNYKEKDKHSKNQSKLSNSSKDKDSASVSLSTRDSRDKSSKSSKNKDANNTSMTAMAVTTGTTNLNSNEQSSSANTSSSATGQNSNINTFGVTSSGSGSNNTKDTAKISSSAGNTFSNDIQPSNAYTTSYGSISMDGSNQSTASSGAIPTTTKSSSSNTAAKKRKSDSKLNSLHDDINSSFRDIIKDVSVTLTPLQQTDFEKEIEKSSKRV
ncbi:protein AF-10-like isoform X1 [Teleopsis dalmanni]|uniref:protein AF-10-like isoform X1 n=1 Tax=Teleopsis dalmanni TaxID=139649 RepID=UPI0018CCD10A|nr:protein AF-10-like isoform X1 [Teleopsis dalmanni]